MSYILNKKAKFNYEILETLEAGIELTGSEVKSVKNKQGNIDASYAIIRGGEAFLIGADIPPFQGSNVPSGYDRMRNRKLLLSKKEIRELAEREQSKGLTLVPVSLYNKGVKIKVELGIVKGKKKQDKRETIKKRESDRDIERTLKNQKYL